MDGALLLVLMMLGRLEDFLRAYPLGDGPSEQVVARFIERLGRLRALMAQQRDGTVAREAQNKKHRELRRQLTAGPLRHLARIGGALEGEFAEVAAALRQPVRRLSMDEFLGTAQSIAVMAEAQHDLLRARGMGPEALDDLGGQLTEYEQAVHGANAGRRAHTGARAELRSLGRELIQMARQLDGIVEYHFRDNPEVLGAWKSVRNVAWPVGEVVKPVVPATIPEGQPSR
ncbi:MAG: hypothetical protein ABI587_10415 [Gemmatimonadales bacterium]